MNTFLKFLTPAVTAMLLPLMSLAVLPGCDSKEDVLEIETPGGSIDVERDKNTEAIDVEIEDK